MFKRRFPVRPVRVWNTYLSPRVSSRTGPHSLTHLHASASRSRPFRTRFFPLGERESMWPARHPSRTPPRFFCARIVVCPPALCICMHAHTHTCMRCGSRSQKSRRVDRIVGEKSDRIPFRINTSSWSGVVARLQIQMSPTSAHPPVRLVCHFSVCTRVLAGSVCADAQSGCAHWSPGRPLLSCISRLVPIRGRRVCSYAFKHELLRSKT